MICGKVIHDTMRDAKKVAENKNSGQRIYFCEDCNGYHLASNGKNLKMKKRRHQNKRERFNRF